MRWTEEDMRKYEGAKEYIDTAVIPVFSMGIDEVGVDMVREQKWLEEICIYTERQLTGRMLLLPTFYVLHEKLDIPGLSSHGFLHVVFVTTNEQLYGQLQEMGADAYLLPRNENEEELTEMVREGKKLTKSIMQRWEK